MKYFAYGSNMSLLRLRQRVPSAERIAICTLEQHSLRFHKVSHNDGSAKCDALFTGYSSDTVIGALYEIQEAEKQALDKIEGLGYGYQDKTVSVIDPDRNIFEAVTYYATHTNPSLLPYSWYLNHVIIGAREIQVPPYYLDALAAIKSIDDPDIARDEEERAIYY